MHGITIVCFIMLALAAAAVPARADTGYYAIASIGESSADFGAILVPTLADDDRSFEIGAGYAFNRHFAVQAGYHDFGEFNGRFECPPEIVCVPPDPTRFQVDLTGWSLKMTGTYPFGERFATFVSAGVLVWDTEQTFLVDDDFTPVSFGSEGDDFVYGAGIRFRLTDQWSLQASYEKANLDIESTSIGVLLRF